MTYFNPGLNLNGAGTPTIAAGAGAGTLPTLTVSGNDNSGTIDLTSGSLPTGSNAEICTVTFGSVMGTTPRVVFSPVSTAAALLSSTGHPYIGTTNTTSFKLISGSVALSGATSYIWNYHVIG